MSVYAIVRCHGLMSRLLSKDEILSLLDTDFRGVIKRLLDTDYYSVLAEREIRDVDELVLALAQKYHERVAFVVSLAPKEIAQFLRLYARRIEIDSVLTAVRLLLSGERIDPRRIPIPIPDELKVALTHATNLRELIERIRRRWPYSKISDASVRLALDIASPIPIEADVLRTYYRRMAEHIERLPHETREFVMQVLGVEIDVFNAVVALSPLLFGYSTELARSWLLPLTYMLKHQALIRAMSAHDIEEAISALRAYASILKPLMMGEEETTRVLALREMRRRAEKLRIYAAMDPAYLFLYVTLAEMEYRDLCVCAYRSYYRFSKELARKFLTF